MGIVQLDSEIPVWDGISLVWRSIRRTLSSSLDILDPGQSICVRKMVPASAKYSFGARAFAEVVAISSASLIR